jgi:hypothetical protein
MARGIWHPRPAQNQAPKIVDAIATSALTMDLLRLDEASAHDCLLPVNSVNIGVLVNRHAMTLVPWLAFT